MDELRKRRSRMHRTSIGKQIQLTPRDIDLFRLLSRYRILRSTFLHAFLGGNRTRFIERLGDLFHEGYLDRPAQQWQYANALYMPLIYELGKKGRGVLRDWPGAAEESPLLNGCGAGVSRQFAHQLMICDILASIELGVRERADLRFIGWPEILSRAPDKTRGLANPFQIPVSFDYAPPRSTMKVRTALKLEPDGLFGLEYMASGAKTYRFFALEADRGHMPVRRRDVRQSSYAKKILAYREIAGQGIFRSHLGLPNAMVLTVTTSERHMQSMTAVLNEIAGEKGSTLFLFKTFPTLGDFQTAPRPSAALLSEPWHRAGHEPLSIWRP